MLNIFSKKWMCPVCNARNTSKVRFCPECGTEKKEYRECYDAFISYRRDGGSEAASVIQLILEKYGKHAFLDVTELQVGRFDEKLLERIEKDRSFILVLSPGALDRCVNKTDWLKREILHALQNRKCIIPVILPGFVFPEEKTLSLFPKEMHNLLNYQAVSFDLDNRDAMGRKLAQFIMAGNQPIKKTIIDSVKDSSPLPPATVSDSSYQPGSGESDKSSSVEKIEQPKAEDPDERLKQSKKAEEQARYFIKQGQHDKALEIYRQQESIARRKDSFADLVNTLVDQANILCTRTETLPEARAKMMEAQEIAVKRQLKFLQTALDFGMERINSMSAGQKAVFAKEQSKPESLLSIKPAPKHPAQPIHLPLPQPPHVAPVPENNSANNPFPRLGIAKIVTIKQHPSGISSGTQDNVHPPAVANPRFLGASIITITSVNQSSAPSASPDAFPPDMLATISLPRFGSARLSTKGN